MITTRNRMTFDILRYGVFALGLVLAWIIYLQDFSSDALRLILMLAALTGPGYLWIRRGCRLLELAEDLLSGILRDKPELVRDVPEETPQKEPSLNEWKRQYLLASRELNRRMNTAGGAGMPVQDLRNSDARVRDALECLKNRIEILELQIRKGR